MVDSLKLAFEIFTVGLLALPSLYVLCRFLTPSSTARLNPFQLGGAEKNETATTLFLLILLPTTFLVGSAVVPMASEFVEADGPPIIPLTFRIWSDAYCKRAHLVTAPAIFWNETGQYYEASVRTFVNDDDFRRHCNGPENRNDQRCIDMVRELFQYLRATPVAAG